MKRFGPLALAAALLIPSAANAFDVSSPNSDSEVRELSERLHVSAGSAFAHAPRRAAASPMGTRQTQSAVTPVRPYDDTRERVLRGNDY